MSVAQIADEEPVAETVSTVAAMNDFDAGGTVAALHQDIARRFAVGGVNQVERAAPRGLERLVQGVSRAAGPVLLAAGYAAIGVALYHAFS